MAEQNVHQQLAEMYYTVGGPKTPEFMKVLRLQFTPPEARVAVQIGFTGGKLDELSEKTGIENERLKRILNTMAGKGTMWIDPGKEDPTYRVVGMAGPGLTETGVWGNIRFPFTVELGELLHQVIYDWSKETVCKRGVPIIPVWAAPAGLPDDALSSENVVEFLREAGHWSVSPCPCRFSHWLVDPGNHCQHILETCFHTDDVSRWAVEHGMARELTYDEVIELLRKCNEDGLVCTGLGTGFGAIICNCCNDCCAFFVAPNDMGTRVLRSSPFVSQVDEQTCNACKACAEACPVGAIEIDEVAWVDQDNCLGCGVCVLKCKPEALKLVRRPETEKEQAPTKIYSKHFRKI